jgi:hypothetical protein
VPIKVLNVVPENNYATFAGVFSLNQGTPTGEGTGVKLGDKNGDRLELSIEFRFLENGVKDLDIRIGLFNNAGTPSKDHNPAPYADDVGYWLMLPQKGGHGAVFKELGKNGTIAGGSDRIPLRATIGKAIPALGETWHTITLELKRENKGIIIQGKLDGVVFATGIDTTGPEDKLDPPGIIPVFHEVGISTGIPKNKGLYIRRVLLQGNPKEVATVTASAETSSASSALLPSASVSAPVITIESTSAWSPWMTWACVGGGVILVSSSVLITMVVMRRKSTEVEEASE